MGRGMETKEDILSSGSNPPGTLEIRHISKAFPNVQALDDVSLDIKAGEVLAFVW